MGTTDPRAGGYDERHARDGTELPGLRRADWERPSPPSRAETAAERVAERVARSRPGARLGTKEELRAECGVSVGTFNEALRLLQTRGLVTVRPGPGGGLFAAQPPPRRRDAWAEALDGQRPGDARRVRDALDPLLVEDALWHASPADIAGLRRCLAPLAEAADAADPAAFALADRRLRARLAALGPGGLLRSLYAGLLPLAERAEAEADADPGALRARYERRAALVDALDARDHDLALRLSTADGDGSDDGRGGGAPGERAAGG
ncbi:FCD domain-containing protein [Streptomyces sp. URMC 126]|uniref:FCD domain-containing protein n=1 Tax=Streptomyces sp. URMC 126 TaxID=3423401 RepID=UPI003F1B4664